MSLYSETNLAILLGLAGLISGLTVRKISSFRRVQNILIVAGINSTVAFLFLLMKFEGDTYYTLRGIFWSSAFLIGAMLIFANVARPKQAAGELLSDEAKSQAAQRQDTTGRAMWFFQIWWVALTKPREETYLELIENQKPSWIKGYWWVFASGLLGGVLGFFVTGEILSDIFYSPGILAIILVFALAFGILSVTGFTLDSLIAHVTANAQGGKGTYPAFSYLWAAINAPVMGINSFLVALGIVRTSYSLKDASWISGLTIFIILGLIYTAFLGIVAIIGTRKLDLRQSLIAVIPSRVYLAAAVIALSVFLSNLT